MQLSLLYLCIVLFSKTPLLLAQSDSCVTLYQMVADSKELEFQIAAIEEIEKQRFSEPWTKREFQTYFKQEPNNSSGRKNQGLVALRDGKIVGYVLFEEEGPLPVRILTIAVDQQHAREGIGRALISEVIRKTKKGITALTRETNTNAQLFFRNLGFNGKLIKTPYNGSSEDGILFTLPVSGTTQGSPN